MPWLGFFDKIAKADVWIVLDHVKNNPRHAGWWRRVKVLTHDEPRWVSIPLRRPTAEGALGVPINRMLIDRSASRNMRKCEQTILQSYARSPGFGDVAPFVKEYFATAEQSLAQCNMNFIVGVMKLLDISTEIVYSSSLDPCGSSNALLVDLLQKTQATTYLCGDGADGYQDDSVFGAHHIHVRRNQFAHPEYQQGEGSRFMPGLSVIDGIAWAGTGAAKKWFSAEQ